MPDADEEYCRMCDSLPQGIAANALEYSEVPLCPIALSIAANAQDTQRLIPFF
jgi:hypothetical protein